MYNIAIDGPAGAGKSTVAKILAKKLKQKGINSIYVDTGAIYRAVTYFLLNNIKEQDLDNEKLVQQYVDKLSLEVKYIDENQHVYVNGQDVIEHIRTSKVSKWTSKIATFEGVRKALFDIQKDIASKNNVVMDGRDIGSNILKDAQLKIFLVASVEVRAKRRYEQAMARGEEVDFDKLVKEIKERDERDEKRKISPTRQAVDAIKIDSSNMSINEVVNEILGYVNG